MIRSYTCTGEYKGYIYKIISARTCKQPKGEYRAVVEINGIKRHTRIGNQKNIFASIDDGINAAKRFIDSITQGALSAELNS